MKKKMNDFATRSALSLAQALLHGDNPDIVEFDRNGTTFRYLELTEKSHARMRDMLCSAICEALGVALKFETVRLHWFKPEDMCTPHVDNIHEGYDTIIVRLDDNDDPRLSAVGYYCDDTRGAVNYLSEGTIHQVLPGKTERYTLVAWAKQVPYLYMGEEQ